MNIKIIALGKLKEQFLKDGINEFLKRLTSYANVEVLELQPIEIKDAHLITRVLEQEGEKIMSHIKQNSYVITLEIQGQQLSSESFSLKLSNLADEGFNEIVFIIGSSYGLCKTVSSRANYKLSLSKMTYLHQFTRLILLEQIYRAFKIQKGETYHK